MSVPAWIVELVTSSLTTREAAGTSDPNPQPSRARATKSRDARGAAGYVDRGPVANVPSCGRKHLHRTGLGTLGNGRQIADHAPRPISQSKLDRPVQIRHGITQPDGDLKDNNLTLWIGPDPYRWTGSLALG